VAGQWSAGYQPRFSAFLFHAYRVHPFRLHLDRVAGEHSFGGKRRSARDLAAGRGFGSAYHKP
jgi:hypothetical protein